MTTQIEQASPPKSQSGAPSIWPLVPALLWGAVMLGILSWWLYASDLSVTGPLVGGTLLAAGASLVLFIAATVQWFKAGNDATKLRDIDTKMRPIVAVLLFAAGVLLLFLAIWLETQDGSKVFAQVSSMIVIALICLGGGWSLYITAQSPLSRQRIFQWMLAHRKEVAIGLMIVGVAAAGAGVYFFYKSGFANFASDFPGGPEALCLIVIGVALLGGGLYTFLNLDRPATVETIRLLTLYSGSLTGFAIALFTAVRMRAWWNRYFLSGMANWQGDEGWHFWLCIYVEFFGLALLFGSLLLARIDIRANVSMRRTLYGYNAVLTGFLLAVILLVLNIFTFVTLPSDIDWRGTGMVTLSGQSEQILQGLKDHVKVYVHMQRFADAYLDVPSLLHKCQGYTDKLTVEYLSPDLDAARYRDLASRYPELKKQTESDFRGAGGYGRGLLVVYGEGPEGAKLPHVFIPDKDLQDMEPGGKAIYFKGESALMTAIVQLANKDKKYVVYFTQLSGELLINDRFIPDNRILRLAGAGEVADRLRKDGYEVKGLVWQTKPVGGPAIAENFVFAKKSDKDEVKVPEDCAVLVLAGPARPLPKDALKAIDEYVDKGGKVIVLT